MKKYSITSPILLIAIVILQTTVLKNLAFKGVKPDLVLIILVIFSNYFGTVRGELIGAGTGIIQDLLSLSPLGFNVILNSVTGYLSGLTKGKIFLDPLITPVVLVSVFTLLKETVSFLLLAVFIPDNTGQVFNQSFLISEVMNLLITPFVFYLLKITKLIPEYETPGF